MVVLEVLDEDGVEEGVVQGVSRTLDFQFQGNCKFERNVYLQYYWFWM